MRIRWAIPLPGPFYITGGGRGRGGWGCLPWLAAAVVLGYVDWWAGRWWWAVLAGAGAVVAAAAVIRRPRRPGGTRPW